jgi:sarcosine oxidase subunit gamma
MPDHPGFELHKIEGRTMVRLRVRPNGAEMAVDALQLPGQALQYQGDDPTSYWLSPDQWLITSDTRSSKDIISHIQGELSGQLYAATDMSSSNACFALSGPAARTVLAMGCGIDMHISSFSKGHCVRTRFANIPILIAAVEDNQFDLFVDRSLGRYLADWIKDAGKDPLTHNLRLK